MASEVNHHVGYSRENECWFVRFYPYQTEQQASEAAAAFTRPAPAATDTGLETVATQVRLIGDDHFRPFKPLLGEKLVEETRELVTRQNAEEVIAAERMKLEAAAKVGLQLSERVEALEADNASLIHDLNRIKDHETELINDNTAKDARIAELEMTVQYEIDVAQSEVDGRRHHEAENKRLREALERIADWTNGGKNYGQENIKSFARAALGEVKL